MKKKKFILLVTILIGLSACADNRNSIENQLEKPVETMESLVVPISFNFSMSREVEISLKNSEMSGARFRIYDGIPEDGGNLLTEGLFDETGNYSSSLRVAQGIESLYIQSDFITLESVMLDITGNKIVYNYNDENVDTNLSSSISKKVSNMTRSSSTEVTKGGFTYISDYNNNGLPNIISKPRPTLANSWSKDFLSKLNATFIEGNSIPKNRTDLVSLIRDREITILNDCVLDLTFLHKVAGYNNSLAYYTYYVSNPPKTKADITNLKMIFPNVTTNDKNKFEYLVSGDKVSLGSFKAGTVVGFALVSNGWNGSKKIVDSTKPITYSNPILNGGVVSNVMLYDVGTKNVVFGFEDIPSSSSDYDMNDVIFGVSTTNIENIKKDNFPELSSKSVDYNGAPIYEYYPSKDKFSTVAYEDLWPQKGDYDFNDQVVNYNYKLTKNAKDEITQIDATYKVKAVGAGWIASGFGISLDVDKSKIQSVNGYKTSDNVIKRDTNGLESGQNKSVVIVYDNAKKLFEPYGTLEQINTKKENSNYNYKEINIVIKFVAGTKYTDIKNKAPFNPFIFRTGARGHEVHLPTGVPTSLADSSLFGTMDDKSDISTGKYYRTANNLPWAIDVPYDYKYTVEGKSINLGYKRFIDWAKSGGTEYIDWYNVGNGKENYFDNSLMY